MGELDSTDSGSATAALPEAEEVWEPLPGVTLRGRETIALIQGVLAQLSSGSQLSCGCVDTGSAESPGPEAKSRSSSA